MVNQIEKIKAKEIYNGIINDFSFFPKDPNFFLIILFIFIIFPFYILKMLFLIVKECLLNKNCSFKNMLFYLWEYSHTNAK